jgi:ornithine carbamoyltransferase
MTKHLLSLFDIDGDQLQDLFVVADELKANTACRPLSGRVVTQIYQKPSLRTRVSFEVGIRQLGGETIVLSQEGIGLGTRESTYDVATVLSGYGDMIVARLFSHQTLLELARHATVPVINALTDLSHPCQVLADLYTMRQHRRLHPGVKVAFVGDGNNVVNSWLEMAAIYPMHFTLAAPAGYEPDPETLRRAKAANLSVIEITDDPAAAVHRADVIYTDVWTSMGQEAESEARRTIFAPYQVNSALLSLAKPDCAIMHCLPAHRGEEITAEVLEGGQSIVFDQAQNRLHVQKAVMKRLIEPQTVPQYLPARRHRIPVLS